MSSGRLEGKRAFLTGAGGGLVAEIARAFAAEGAELVLAGRTPANVQSVADEISAGGGTAFAVELDVADADAVQAAVESAHRRMGGLDIVLNGAAIDTGWAPSADMDREVWDATIAINLSGTYYVCRSALPLMVAAGGGAIVNITSVAGHKAWAEDVAYNASKAGVDPDDQDDRGRVRDRRHPRQLPGARGDRRRAHRYRHRRRRSRAAGGDASDGAAWAPRRRWPRRRSGWPPTRPPSRPAGRWRWTAGSWRDHAAVARAAGAARPRPRRRAARSDRPQHRTPAAGPAAVRLRADSWRRPGRGSVDAVLPRRLADGAPQRRQPGAHGDRRSRLPRPRLERPWDVVEATATEPR